MRKSRGIPFAQRLNELVTQLSELEDLRGQVAEAERRARRAFASQSKRSTSRPTHPPSGPPQSQ